ncbi:O-antigen polymerase [Bacteroides pyogenes]|nr:O-antigen polymerase [Bacteroides pyogenes]
MEEKHSSMIAVAFMLSIPVFFLLDSNVYRLFVLLYMVLVGIMYFKVDILYPYVWLSPFLFLYGTSVFILDVLGVRTTAFPTEILNCVFTSIVTLYFGCVLFIKQKHVPSVNLGFLERESVVLLRRVVIILGVVLLLYIPLFLASGYTSKMETNLNGGLYGFGIVSRAFILMYIVYMIFIGTKSKIFDYSIAIKALVITLLISLFLGERDVFFSICLSTFVIYYYFKKPSIKVMSIFAGIAIVLVPILGMTKQITNKDSVEFDQQAIIEGIFQGEFLSSGHNIEVLLVNKNSWDFQYGKSLVNDILRVVVPSSIVKVDNSTGWYNKRYNLRIDEGFGAGFSYVGEGYLQAGYCGIVIWILILLFIIKKLYLKHLETVFGFSAYVFMIGLIIYAMRGDLSYVISPLVKQVLFGYLFIRLLYKFFGNRYTRYSN